MKKKLYLFRIGIVFLFVVFSAAVVSAQNDRSVDANSNVDAPFNAPFSWEKPRLDGAAIELKDEPDKIVYLVVGKANSIKKSVAFKRIKESKKYLIRKHKISRERIITAYGENNSIGLVLLIYVSKRTDPPPMAIKEIIF